MSLIQFLNLFLHLKIITIIKNNQGTSSVKTTSKQGGISSNHTFGTPHEYNKKSTSELPVQQYAVKQTAISNYSQNPLKLLQQTTMHCKRSLFASQHYHSRYIIFNIKSKIQKTTQKYNGFQSTKHKGVQPCTPEFILSLFVFPYINFNNI